ncbi:MAG: PLD nuclease N-terminal domain-containing protein [Bifidobacteriaceae bacterium]|jgi:hypothetical protein|nr:PLD nuclease N-terminal domain-containing protein [Bifidobacteriaceae bacterium]
MAVILFVYVVPLALMVFAIVDCATDDDVERTSVPKVLWMMAIVLLPYFGALAWLAVSKIAKPRGRGSGGTAGWPVRRPGPLAPDDNPAYLRRLAEEQARKDRERRRRDAEGGGNAA